MNGGNVFVRLPDLYGGCEFLRIPMTNCAGGSSMIVYEIGNPGGYHLATGIPHAQGPGILGKSSS